MNGSTLSSGTASIAAGATLGGNGSVGSVTVNGTIAAGPDAATVGTLSTGAETWAAGGTFLDKFAADNAANDHLVLSGLTVSGSPFTVNLTGANAGTATGAFVLATDTGAAAASDSFVLGSLTLTVNGTAAPAGYALAEQADVSFGGGVDLVLTTAAPEPTSLLLVGLACGPLLGRRRPGRFGAGR